MGYFDVKDAVKRFGEDYVVNWLDWESMSNEQLLRFCIQSKGYDKIQGAIFNVLSVRADTLTGYKNKILELRKEITRLTTVGLEIARLNDEIIKNNEELTKENAVLKRRIDRLDEINDRLSAKETEKNKEIAKLSEEIAALREMKTYMTSDITPTYDFDLTGSPEEFIDECYSTDRHSLKDDDPMLYEDVIPIYNDQDQKIKVRIIRKFR